MKFINENINIKELPKDYVIEPNLVENNEKQISEMSSFLMSECKLALVNGFKGSGKSEILNYVIHKMPEDVLKIHYTCFETTILDDLLLCLFEKFRNYVIAGTISQPKIKVDNFTQRINSYFNFVEKPIFIVIDSFEAIIKENKEDIINFINHLTSFPNVKVILIANKFGDEFNELEPQKITILAFSQKLFEKHLKDNGIKNIGVLSNELYKLTKGYYKQLDLSIKIITIKKLTLVKFLEMYSKSYMTFSEFITREALSIVDPVSAHLFRLLTVMRIPIHINLLKSLHLFNEDTTIYFIQNSILSYEGNCLYLKDEFRNIIENQIQSTVSIKLHKSCIDLYNTQLPLNPNERDLVLSRQTMRNEIEYHSMFLPKTPQLIKKEEKTINKEVQKQEPQVTPQTTQNETTNSNKNIQQQESKEEKIKKISFIIEDESLLDNIANSITTFIKDSANTTQLEKESSSMSLRNILNMAKEEEQKYNYKRVVMLYHSALNKTSDDDFYTFLPSIYTKLAKAYLNLSDLYNALEYFTQAEDFYYNSANNLKLYETKLEIANIYYGMYKNNNAKYVLSELEKAQDLPNELKIKVNIASAKLADNPKLEYNYYKKSIPLVELNTEKTVVSELYYKYAIASSEQDDIRTAAQFYLKCIDIDTNPKRNPYLSRAMSNLAELYDEIGNTKLAIQYYKESLQIDFAIKNYNGLYTTNSHLAEIYSSEEPTKALEYYYKALEYAKTLNDPFYIVTTTLEIGDYYALRRNLESAYKYYMDGYNMAKTTLTQENLDKITSRLEEIKKRLSTGEHLKLRTKYGEPK